MAVMPPKTIREIVRQALARVTLSLDQIEIVIDASCVVPVKASAW